MEEQLLKNALLFLVNEHNCPFTYKGECMKVNNAENSKYYCEATQERKLRCWEILLEQYNKG